jgi:hypothetical protein
VKVYDYYTQMHILPSNSLKVGIQQGQARSKAHTWKYSH